MAAVKTEKKSQSVDTTPGCVEDLDIEQYINTDSFSPPSPSMSPESTSYKTSTAATPSSNPLPYPTQQTEQVFSGPSHQYDQYRQQASLPVGAIANTFALNESAPYTFGQDNYDLIASNSYLGSNIADDYLDLDLSANDQFDLDTMDFNMDSNGFGSSGAGSSSGQARLQSSTQHVRAWPGMHQQAAMQAKAQAEAEAQRRSQAKQQPRSQSREGIAGRIDAEDPHVEESISRLLHRMRHSSVASTNADDAVATPTTGNGANGAKTKKDEEDMDEDERLLASEEGKKLSSKERRQLRNKVSARAFRSRRKEYIGQLEGELAAKAAEADRFRTQNEQLTAENGRLTDLTRMLLSSPHFSTFLDELSANRGQLPSFAQPASQQTLPTQQQLPSQLPKDVNPHSHQSNLRVGLATIPENSFENLVPSTSNSGWASNPAFDQRVFAVTCIPDEPIIDTEGLSNKSAIGTFNSSASDKTSPQLNSMKDEAFQSPLVQTPILPEYPVDEDVDFDENDTAYSLFSEDSSRQSPSTAAIHETMIADIAAHKIAGSLQVSVSEANDGQAVMDKLERMRAQIEGIGARIDHLCWDL